MRSPAVWFRDRYNQLFFFLCLSVIVAFLVFRPFNSPWHPFIAGDGLGYYSYLPAKIIYNDPGLDFKWFNGVYNSTYVYNAFETPEENLLVDYKGKKINKYYPGLSYIWFPFFLAAHALVKIVGLPPDGFGWPYQYAMALASLFYFLAGMIFLRKLLLRLFPSASLSATLAPFFIFYGSHLFNYTLNYNTHSHVYSFAFISIFFYCAVRLQQSADHRLLTLLCLLLMLVLNVSIRPLNGLIVLCLPAFLNKNMFSGMMREKFTFPHILVIGLTLAALAYHSWISFTQTGSVFSYTYTDEKFEFGNNRFLQSLFSYHIGLFIYVPLFFFAFIGSFYMKRRAALVLGGFFLLVLFLYSSWWYWPITKRAMVDFYVIPAVFLCAALERFEGRKGFPALISALVLSVLYYQLKYHQMKEGILPEYTAYKEIFWKNFLQTQKRQRYPVPPESISKSVHHKEDFEAYRDDRQLSGDIKKEKFSYRLDSKKGIHGIIMQGYPDLLKEAGTKKIRLSFDAYFVSSVREVHVFLLFLDEEGKHLLEIPFYLKEDAMVFEQWDRVEFGYEYNHFDNADKAARIEMRIWNVEGKDAFYIDNAFIECMLTDDSYETIK